MNLFVYGTLLADAVVKSVLGKHVETLPAVLTGYKRLRLKNRVYPGILKADASLEISGKVYLLFNKAHFLQYCVPDTFESHSNRHSHLRRYVSPLTLFESIADYENEYERVLEEVTQEVKFLDFAMKLPIRMEPKEKRFSTSGQVASSKFLFLLPRHLPLVKHWKKIGITKSGIILLFLKATL